jgi:AbrB family looped-hinge helix DNA binding protein
MGLTVESRIGKKNTVYLPKSVVEALGLEEGQKILLRVDEGRVEVEIIRDPLELALSGKKFASMRPEEVEEMSLERQGKIGRSS